jgi:parallel beta-helix repeat protein
MLSHTKSSLSGKVLFIFFLLILLPSFLHATIINIPDDQPTIQAGIDATVHGDTVLVQPGTYNERVTISERNIVLGSLFLTTGDSSYIASTLIGGAHVSNLDSTAIITGFTIDSRSSAFGGAIWCGQADLEISHNIISNNHASYFGGGICLEGNSNARIIHNQITGNYIDTPVADRYGGGIYCGESSPLIANNIISNNYGPTYGGGIYCTNSSPVIEGNVFVADSSGQYGGAVYLNYSDAEIRYNLFSENWSMGGGAIYCTVSSPNISNNTFSGNSGFWNSALYLISTDTLRNNIFSFNTASNGAVCAIGNILVHCDFFGNVPADFAVPPAAGTGILTTTNTNGDSCDVYSNLFLDPLFVDTTSYDYHLTEFSPCIDAGDPVSPLDPDGTIADIGALYFDQTVTLDPPQNVTIEISDIEVTLSWVAVTGADSYRVYSSEYPFSGFVEDSSGSFIDESWTAPLVGVWKYYYVQASSVTVR